MNRVSELYGSMVFGDCAMKERLPKDIYNELRKTIDEGLPLTLEIASAVANAMKNWAVEKGVTHFTHWFQPMTGITAEKHDSFITPIQGDRVIMEFSGKELIKGEPDASSFPSGGLRVTFEARGYTAWDPTSYAFIKNNTLCIPTAFCSYSGQALDKKTPLLRSMEAINRQALRVLKLFGKTSKRVVTTVGPEQEYFLIDKELYRQRKDLIFTGRTLFGARAPKGQEMEDHYFGAIHPRVQKFMAHVNEELWKVGVLAKTEHNEAAPSQHELAPIFSTVNVAADHNQIIMEILRTVAEEHGFACLLHEKPFKGVNGSGKHNNWSIATVEGENLLEPGKTPYEDAQFLLFLCSVIKAVDEYQDLLRSTVASAGNDHRLGANEAPPAIISIFLGEELTEILEAIENDTPYLGREKKHIRIGVDVLPDLPKDSMDRNRTSPFAFTGNRFEFRMMGSSFSISGANIVLNTIVAEELSRYADALEKAQDFQKTLHELIRQTIIDHKRILFNGNNYTKEWEAEARRRGLSNHKSSADAIPRFVDRKNIDVCVKHNVFTEEEQLSRCALTLESYCKVINIEVQTMLSMARQEILPAGYRYIRDLSESACAKTALCSDLETDVERALVGKLSDACRGIYQGIESLSAVSDEMQAIGDVEKQAIFIRDRVIPAMDTLRGFADELETLTAKEYWPFPTYDELLFGV